MGASSLILTADVSISLPLPLSFLFSLPFVLVEGGSCKFCDEAERDNTGMSSSIPVMESAPGADGGECGGDCACTGSGGSTVGALLLLLRADARWAAP